MPTLGVTPDTPGPERTVPVAASPTATLTPVDVLTAQIKALQAQVEQLQQELGLAARSANLVPELQTQVANLQQAFNGHTHGFSQKITVATVAVAQQIEVGGLAFENPEWVPADQSSPTYAVVLAQPPAPSTPPGLTITKPVLASNSIGF